MSFAAAHGGKSTTVAIAKVTTLIAVLAMMIDSASADV
jgi:hypothetical protein